MISLEANAKYHVISAQITALGGYSMIMTLPNGDYLIRFLTPQLQIGKGTRGIYTEGIDATFEGALLAATSGLVTEKDTSSS